MKVASIGCMVGLIKGKRVVLTVKYPLPSPEVSG
jgi:hypothetical protein